MSRPLTAGIAKTHLSTALFVVFYIQTFHVVLKAYIDNDQYLHLVFIIFIMLFLIFFPSIQKQRFKYKSNTVDQTSWGDRINHWGSQRKPGC